MLSQLPSRLKALLNRLVLVVMKPGSSAVRQAHLAILRQQ